MSSVCSPCSGKGQVKCPQCNGNGKLWAGFFNEDKPCPLCHGYKTVPCNVCGGSGKV